MAFRDYGMTLSYNEIANIGTVGENIIYDNNSEIIACDNGRENMTYDVQANSSEESYLLSAPSSPECVKLNPTNNPSAKLNRYNMRSSSNCGFENIHLSSSGKCTRKSHEMNKNKTCGKKDSHKRAKKGIRNFAKNKIIPKQHKPVLKTKISGTYKSRSNVFQNSDDKELIALGSAAGTKLLVSELALPKLKKNKNLAKAKELHVMPVTSLSHLVKPTTTSTLLSMMADAVSAPKYTSVQESISSTGSDYPEFPARSTWPLLREMIAKPSVSVVSISPAPRQTLSTVIVDPVNSEEPKANVISKLEKEIRCECKFNKGKPCWVLFQEDRLRKERLHHLTLKRESLDLVILAKIAANINREEKTKKYHGRDRQRCRVCYYHEGRQICRETFMFIHGICKGRLCALMQHYKKKGLSVRVHGNKSNVPHHALSYKDSERVLDFIREYANNHCISSFGRKPGSKAGGGLLIMSPTQSKLYVHHKYKVWCSRNNHRAVSLRSFQNLWTKHLPYIVVLRGSNKNPVPEHGSEESVLELHDHTELREEFVTSEMASEKSSLLPTTSKVNHTNNTLKGGQSQQDDRARLVHCGTNTHLDFYYDGRKKRKRKGLPPRKVDTSSCLPPISAGRDLRHNPNFDESHLVHAPASDIHNSCFNSIKSVRDSSDDNITQNTLDQSDLHHSMFSSDLHIPQSTPTSPLHGHPTTVINFQSQPAAAPVMLTANRDMIYTYNNKTSIPMSKTAILQPSLYLSQPSQLSDSYSMQCSDRFVPQMSGSHGLGDQSQSVLLPHQGSDFSSMHHIDWQTWQTYSTL